MGACAILDTQVYALHLTGDKTEAGRRLQPYTDYLVYSAVIALPWLAPELQHLESDPEGLTTFSSSVEQYLSVRPCSSQEALNPFSVGSEQEGAAPLGDGGGAAFLPQVGTSFVPVAMCNAISLRPSSACFDIAEHVIKVHPSHSPQMSHSMDTCCHLQCPASCHMNGHLSALLAAVAIHAGAEGQPVEAHQCAIIQSVV